MANPSRRAIIRCTNLGLLLDDPKVGGPAELARALGRPKMKAHLSNIRHGHRTMGDSLAAPMNPAYLTFDSHEEGLRIVAVFKGRLEPDDD